MLRRVSIAMLAGATMLVAAPIARADDAAVKQVVATQEAKLAPDNKALAKVIDHVTKSNAGKAKTAITHVTTDITGYRTELLKTRASTSKIKKGRMALLTALREQRSGLRAFKSAITKYANGGSEASVKTAIGAAVKKLKAGQKDAARAAKLLGLTA
jgi:hypothetical protein